MPPNNNVSAIYRSQKNVNRTLAEVERASRQGKGEAAASVLYPENKTRRLERNLRRKTMKNVSSSTTPGKVKRLVSSSRSPESVRSDPNVQELQQRLNDISYVLTRKNLTNSQRATIKQEIIGLEAELDAIIKSKSAALKNRNLSGKKRTRNNTT